MSFLIKRFFQKFTRAKKTKNPNKITKQHKQSITTVSFIGDIAVSNRFSCIGLPVEQVAFHDVFSELDLLRAFVEEIQRGEHEAKAPELLTLIAKRKLISCKTIQENKNTKSIEHNVIGFHGKSNRTKR